jgi:hypothetical protein
MIKIKDSCKYYHKLSQNIIIFINIGLDYAKNGATALSITTLSITTLSIMTFSITINKSRHSAQ